MPTKPYTALSIAVGTGRIGFVFVIDGEPTDWGISNDAAKSPDKARAKMREWIEFYSPQIIVTERLTMHTRKSGRTVENIAAIAKVANEDVAQYVEVERIQRYPSKYAEIDALVERYPQIAKWAPDKRKLWESEPRNTVLFEALSLIGEVA